MRKNNLFWGVMIVLLGIMFLLNTLGVVSFNVWQYFWPILLILLGLSFLLGPIFFKRQPSEKVSIPLGEIQKAQIKLQHGAGEIRLSSGASVDELAAGDFFGGVEQDIRSSNQEAFISFNAQPFSFPSWSHEYGLKWDIRLNSVPVLDLVIKTGASESHLDLTDLQVNNLELSTGASSTSIQMPAHTAFTKAKIEGGAASFKIYVPENVAARIHFEGGLIDVKVDQNRFPRNGEYYISPNYDESDHKADIYFNGGVGSVNIQ